MNAPPLSADSRETTQGSKRSTQSKQEPIYVRLWEATKRRKNGVWDPEALVVYEQFKQLHAKQIEEHGVDNLSVEEAYLMILGERNGYIRGLGNSVRAPKKSKKVESNVLRGKVEQNQQAEEKREATLREEIQELKSAFNGLPEEIKRMKVEAVDRENKLREELRAGYERMKVEAVERDNKLREEILQIVCSQFSPR